MTVYTLTRRTGRGPGDEVIDVIHTSEPMPLELEPIRSDWSSPSRLHVPRHQGSASAVWLYVVAVLCVVAAVWGVL